MAAPTPPDWFLRLARALSGDDPAQARAEARGMLDEIREEQGRVRERLEMLASASFEGILVHVDGVVIDANQRVCDMLGAGPGLSRERPTDRFPGGISVTVARAMREAPFLDFV